MDNSQKPLNNNDEEKTQSRNDKYADEESAIESINPQLRVDRITHASATEINEN